jgi:hypothetical protein
MAPMPLVPSIEKMLLGASLLGVGAGGSLPG